MSRNFVSLSFMKRRYKLNCEEIFVSGSPFLLAQESSKDLSDHSSLYCDQGIYTSFKISFQLLEMYLQCIYTIREAKETTTFETARSM